MPSVGYGQVYFGEFSLKLAIMFDKILPRLLRHGFMRSGFAKEWARGDCTNGKQGRRKWLMVVKNRPAAI